MSWLNSAKQIAVNLPGWRTKRKIVIIQSDDWGSIRMPSLRIREQLDRQTLIDASDAYSYNDTLESEDDLSALYEVLTSVKDKKDNSAVISANCLMANPDFDAIRKNDFHKYCYETVEQTFEKYNGSNALHLWHEGKRTGLFIPQFHGREHVNVPFWMEQLREGHKGVRAAFDAGVCSVNFHDLPYRKNNFQAGWDFRNRMEMEEIEGAIAEGMQLFEQMFETSSITAVAPSYVWSHDQEKLLHTYGVTAMQGTPYQFLPNESKSNFKKKFKYTSPPGRGKMGFQMRNAFFEPTLQPNSDVVGECLSRIEIAFIMGKPAIIGSHRLNYIGSLNEKNRTNNLQLLQELLHNIIAIWPQVEFLSSDQLFAT